MYIQDGSVLSSLCLPLRLEFVYSLCIADQLGVLKSIEHIAKTLHRKAHPLPHQTSPLKSNPVERSSHVKEIAEERALTETEVGTRKDHVEVDSKELKEFEELHIYSDVSNSEGQGQHTNYVDITSLSLANAMELETTPVGDSTPCTAAATAYVGASHSTFRFYGKGAGTFIVS